MRKTKIIVTLGPASSTYQIIKALALEGVDAFRLNFSHGDHSEKASKISIIRKVEEDLKRFIPIIADLQGPSIRLGEFKPRELITGKEVKLVYGDKSSNEDEISIPLDIFFKVLEAGDTVLIDDGRISLIAIDVKESEARCKVEIGGNVRPKVTVHIHGKEFNLPALTNKDIEDLEFILNQDIDIIFQSFVRSKEDIYALRKIIKDKGKEDIKIYAKIETKSGMKNIDGILEAADGILIARGDLGMFYPLEEIPLLESNLARKALQYGKPVILATQILESMINNPVPTRAEIVDIFNGISNYVDGMMLSGETAIGNNPILAVRWLRKVIERAEKDVIPEKIKGLNETIYDKFAKGIVLLAESLNAKILAYTKKGTTARRLSRYRPTVPTYVATDSEIIARQINMLWGLIPVKISIDLEKDPVNELKRKYIDNGIVGKGDIAVITIGLRDRATDLAQVDIIS